MKTLLLVDDVPANLDLLLVTLHEAGYEVRVAESGERALRQLQAFTPDLILLDVMMPGLDGFATCERIKVDPRSKDIPVIFMTSLSDTVDKVRGFAVGGVDYITKPLFPEEVGARVETHLKIRSLQIELERQKAELEEQNDKLDQAMQLRIQSEREWALLFDRPIVIVTQTGTVQFLTEAASRLLAKHFPGAALDRLPASLLSTKSSISGPLRVHFNSPPGGKLCLLTLSEERSEPTPELLRPLGLTPRETEILFWVAQGKTSPEIAIILDTSLHNVKKQLQNMLPKLGVETRLAAALKAMELLGPITRPA